VAKNWAPVILLVGVDPVDLSLDFYNFWMFQDVKYDYTVHLTGTGHQSEYNTENY